MEGPEVPGTGMEETSPRAVGKGRQIVVFVLAAILIVVLLTLTVVTFMRGSWWYYYGTDQPLDAQARTHVEGIRDEVAANGLAPEAVSWLNQALDPNVSDPSAVRLYLIAAQESLQTSNDPALVAAGGELGAIIEAIQASPGEASNPYPMPTLLGP